MKHVLLIVFLFTFLSLGAQQKRDVISLRNGSILRGIILEQHDTLVKILTCGESVFAIPAHEVLNIRQERARSMESAPRKGYLGQISMGVLIGTGEDENPAPFSAMFEHQYRFNKVVALGGFFGFEELNENTMPLGGVLKLFIPAGRTDLFWSMNGGYSVSLQKPEEEGTEKATGGGMAGTELGVIIPVSKGAALTVALGYRYSKLNYQMNDWWRGDYERDITYQRFSLRFGVAVF
jgi:hypothetical protein